jgi:SAM-dependent methyltransferase
LTHSEPQAIHPTLESLRLEARHVYGRDAVGYDLGRPEYPEEIYDVLTEHCGLKRGAAVLEIGPGAGQVTRRLLNLGARVVAVEPDPGMAAYLTQTFDGADLEIIGNTFEDATLGDDSFDLAVAATSFHWVDPAVGVPKLGRVVRPGGWAAIWWTIFYDPDRPDPYREATSGLLPGEDPDGQRGRSQFQLDADGRRTDLQRLGMLVDVESKIIQWTCRLDSDQVRALYASMIEIRRRTRPEQARLLEALSALARDRFGGVVDLPFVTALYTGRRP